ncbi:hypothetical protein E2542_SST24615 [Spatholobus suberectus]|nr:hypothetical protein E2542_SST24615 [Spatholobus suberectus]
MGNCLAQQEDVVRVMKSDGKILEYETPIEVHHVLKQFPGHAISESLPVLHHLHPNARLLQGQLYYLVPLPQPPPKVSMKRVRFAEPEKVEGDVVRIKLVLSKQELKDMLQKGGISVNEVLSLVRDENGMDGVDVCKKDNDGSHGWKPELETIPE